MRIDQRKRWKRIALAALIALPLGGCSQSQHRLNADREAYCTIAERNHDPRWSQTDVGIEMAPRSRYYDPYNPDCSPMPMDDPASHRYMHCVDGKKGWQHWDRNGIRAQLENPQWRVRLSEDADINDRNEVKLDVDTAVRLAYVHSPLNQRALETLYLTSLDVTGERFRLDTQFFGGNSLDYAHQGNVTPAAIAFNPLLNRYVIAGPSNRPEVNRLTNVNDIEASRRFATAGEVLVGFANSFAFEFTGSDVSLASSLANFSFVQPLLRGAGRDIALEQLTLTERRLLANLRAYSQFRQGFFTQIVIGELGVNEPQRFGPGTNLQSFSGIGGVNGYLGLLQQSQQIRNTQDNLRLQLRTLERLEALYENELIDIVQVDQFRQNIEATRATLLDQTNALELTLDRFTTQTLGLPSDLPIDLNEDLVEPFQLLPPEAATISERLIELQRRLADVGELSALVVRADVLAQSLPNIADQDLVDADQSLRQLRGIVDGAARRSRDLPGILERLDDNGLGLLSVSESETVEQIANIVDSDPTELALLLEEASLRLEAILNSLTEENLIPSLVADSDFFEEVFALSRGIISIQSAANDLGSEPDQVLRDVEELVAPVRELFGEAQNDLNRLEDVASDREQGMSADDAIRFRRDRKRLRERLDDLAQGDAGLDNAVAELVMLRSNYSTENRAATIRGLTAWIQSFLQLVERVALVPAQARLEVIAVEDVELDPDAAFQIALANRLDFMNGRAALVDRWRAIQVAADALQSNLTITGSGDVRTANNNPVDFRSSTASVRLGIEFDAPLARLLERNAYRESLIEYQRNRRNLIQSRDALQLGLRALLRTLEQRKLQLEIQRRAVTIALRRVDQTQLSLLTPPPQGQPGVRPQINPTTAINLLGAQSSLQTSQNSFLSAWLNYYAARLRLFRELGIMQLDPSGRWIENAIEFTSDIPMNTDDVLPPAITIEDVPLGPANPDAPLQGNLEMLNS